MEYILLEVRRSHERGILPKVYAVAARRLRREDARPEVVAVATLAFCLRGTLLLPGLALAGRQAGRKEEEMISTHLATHLATIVMLAFAMFFFGCLAGGLYVWCTEKERVLKKHKKNLDKWLAERKG